MDIQRAHKNESTILRALSEAGQSRVAAEIGVHESSVSKAKDSFQMLAKILAACDLKVVPASARCFDPTYIEALHQLAREHLRTSTEIRTLDWD